MSQNLQFNIKYPTEDPYVLHSLFDEYISDNIGNKPTEALKNFTNIFSDCITQVREFDELTFSTFLLSNDVFNSEVQHAVTILEMMIAKESMVTTSRISAAIENNKKDPKYVYTDYKDFSNKYNFKTDKMLIPYVISCIAADFVKKYVKDKFFLCSGYYDVSAESGHLIGIYYDKDYIVITNSGEGIHHHLKYVNKNNVPLGTYPVILIFKHINDAAISEKLINLTITMKLTYPNHFIKKSEQSYIDRFYELLDAIVDNLEVVERPEIFHKPQISGSCTFFGIYYFIYYYLVIAQNNKHKFSIFDTYLKSRCIESIYNYFSLPKRVDVQHNNFLEITKIKEKEMNSILENGVLPKNLVDNIRINQKKFRSAIESYKATYDKDLRDCLTVSKNIINVTNSGKGIKIFPSVNAKEGTFIVNAAKKVENSNNIIDFVKNLENFVTDPFGAKTARPVLNGVFLAITTDLVYKLLIPITNKSDNFFTLGKTTVNDVSLYTIPSLLNVQAIFNESIKEESITSYYLKIITALLLYIFFKINDVNGLIILKKFIAPNSVFDEKFNLLLLSVKLPYYTSGKKLKKSPYRDIEKQLNMYNLSSILQKYQYYFVGSSNFYYLWVIEFNYDINKKRNKKGDLMYNAFYELRGSDEDLRYTICKNITRLMVPLYDVTLSKMESKFNSYFEIPENTESYSPYYTILDPVVEKSINIGNYPFGSCNHFTCNISKSMPQNATEEIHIKIFIKTPKTYTKHDTNIFIFTSYRYKIFFKLGLMEQNKEYTVDFIFPYIKESTLIYDVEFISSNSLDFMIVNDQQLTNINISIPVEKVNELRYYNSQINKVNCDILQLFHSMEEKQSLKEHIFSSQQYAEPHITTELGGVDSNENKNILDILYYIANLHTTANPHFDEKFKFTMFNLSLGWSIQGNPHEELLLTNSTISKFNYKSNDYAEVMRQSIVSFIDTNLDVIIENLSTLKNKNDNGISTRRLFLIIYVLKYIDYAINAALQAKLLNVMNYYLQYHTQSLDIIFYKNLVNDMNPIMDLLLIFSPTFITNPLPSTFLQIDRITRSYDILIATFDSLSATEINKIRELSNIFDISTLKISDVSAHPFIFSVKNKEDNFCHIMQLDSIDLPDVLKSFYVMYYESNEEKISSAELSKPITYKSVFIPLSPYKNNIYGQISVVNKTITVESKFGSFAKGDAHKNIQRFNGFVNSPYLTWIAGATNIITREYYEITGHANNETLVINYDLSSKIYSININSTVYEIVTTSYNPIFTRWIYGLDECLLLRKTQNESRLMEHKILFLSQKQDYYVSKTKTMLSNVWNKIEDTKVLENINKITEQFPKNKYYLIDLHYTGLFCNITDDSVLSLYYFHNVLIGKHTILYALHQQLVNISHTSINANDYGLYKIWITHRIFNNPYTYFFTNKILYAEINDFTKRKYSYPLLYQTINRNNFPNSETKYNLDDKTFSNNKSKFTTFFKYFIDAVPREESSIIDNLDIDDSDKLGLKNFYTQNKVCRIKNKVNVKKEMNELYNIITNYKILAELYDTLYTQFDIFSYSSYYDFVIRNYNLLYELLNFKIALETVVKLRELCKINLCDSCNEITEVLKQYVNNEVYIGPRDAKILLFETTFGNLIRIDQLKLTTDIISSIKTNNYYVYQLLMGRGKTTVVTPLLVYEFLFNKVYDDTKHIIIVLPNHLIKQSMDNFIGLHGFTLEYLKLSNAEFSATPSEGDMIRLDNFLESSYKDLLIIDDTSFKALRLNAIVTDNLENPAKILQKIRKESITIIDEIDSIYNPLTSDLNYPSSNTFKISSQDVAEKFIIGVIALLFKDHLKEINSKNDVKDSRKFLTAFFSNAKTTISMISKDLLKYQNEYNYFISTYITRTDNKDATGLNLTIIYLFKFIYMCLTNALILIYKKDYGFGIKNNKYGDKNFYTAIPYFAVDTPANGTEFTDIITSIILTTLSYFHYWKSHKTLRQNDITFVMAQVKSVYNMLGEEIAKDYFKNLNEMLITINLDQDISFYAKNNSEEVIESFNKSLEHDVVFMVFIQYYLVDVIFNKFMNISEEQFNISFMDMISNTSIIKKTGFSGTINLILPSTDETSGNFNSTIKTDSVADTTIQCVMLGCILPSQVITLTKEKTSSDILDYVVEHKYNVLIDAGAYFRNDPSNVIAKDIYNRFSKKYGEKRKIIFIDNTNTVMYYDGLLDISNKIEGNIFPAKDSFYYYDHRHIVGTDIKQPPILEGLTTINYFNKLTDTSQAIFRMRNTNNGHSNDFIYINTFPITIKDPKDAAGLYNFLKANENKYMNGYKQKYLLQNIKLLRREQAIKETPTGVASAVPIVDKISDKISDKIKKEYTEELYYINDKSFKTINDLNIDHQGKFINRTICKLNTTSERKSNGVTAIAVGGNSDIENNIFITPDIFYKHSLLRNMQHNSFNSLSDMSMWNFILNNDGLVSDDTFTESNKIGNITIPITNNKNKHDIQKILCSLIKSDISVIMDNKAIQQEQQQEQQLEMDLSQSQVRRQNASPRTQYGSILYTAYLNMSILPDDTEIKLMISSLKTHYGISMSLPFINRLMEENGPIRNIGFSIKNKDKIILVTTWEMYAMLDYFTDIKADVAEIRDANGNDWYPKYKINKSKLTDNVDLIVSYLLGKRLSITETVQLIDIMNSQFELWDEFYNIFSNKVDEDRKNKLKAKLMNALTGSSENSLTDSFNKIFDEVGLTKTKNSNKKIYNSPIEKLFYDAYDASQGSPGITPNIYIKNLFINKSKLIREYFGIGNLDDTISAAIIKTL